MVLLPLDTPSPSGDPPARRESVTTAAGPGGMVDGRSDGGVAAAPLPEDHEFSAWEALVLSFTDPGPLENVSDLIAALAESPELRAATVLRSLDRLRDQMDAMAGGTSLDAKVEIQAVDLVVVTRALLTRLR